MTAEEVGRGLGGRKVGQRWMAPCPAHDDRTPSLAIGESSDGHILLHCFAGCTFAAVRNALRARGMWPESQGGWQVPDPAAEARRQAEMAAAEKPQIEVAKRLSRAARPVTPDDPAGRYLTGRSLPGPWPATLRFLPSARHPTGAIIPALLAAACRWPDRIPVAVQLTALTLHGGKAGLEPVRWTRGAIRGAAAHLAPWREGNPIILVEGVEDGLAVLRAMPEAVPWAVLGASNAGAVVLPKGAGVILALDADSAGRQATHKAADTLTARGHRVRVAALPDGCDLNELLKAPDTTARAA